MTPLLFALEPPGGLGAQVAERLGMPLAPLELTSFEDGELKLRPGVGVVDGDVYVIADPHGGDAHNVNDGLCRLLFCVATLKDAGAARVTVLAPYLAYTRGDRRTQARDPVSQKYVAQLLEAVGTDRIAVVDVHNPAAFENAFRIEARALEATAVLAGAVRERLDEGAVTVVSPDAGGFKRADRFRDALAELIGDKPGLAFVEKRRRDGAVFSGALTGPVTGTTAVIVDDLIASGTTLRHAIAACHAGGARRVLCAVTHGVFAAGARDLLDEPALESLLVTDSVRSPLRAAGHPRLREVSLAPMLAGALRDLMPARAPERP